jgi:hypothetical protein
MGDTLCSEIAFARLFSENSPIQPFLLLITRHEIAFKKAVERTKVW